MLTDNAVKGAKPRDKAFKLTDGQGMYLLVSPDGRRYWRLDYRFGGKRGTFAIGVYPQVSLAQARAKRNEVRELLAEGVDPSAKRKLAKVVGILPADDCFKAVAEEWLTKSEAEGRSESTMHKLRWILEFANPLIGHRRISEVTAPELLAVLRTVEVRGRHETARRLRSTCGSVFRYAVATGRAQRDVSMDLRGALITPKVTHRAAVVDPKEVGQLLRAIAGHSSQPTVEAALRMIPHVFVRPGELRHAEWSEFDVQSAIWTIPAAKTKMRRAHRVPLSMQVLGIIEALRPISGKGKYLFPSIRSAARPISDNTINAALRRLGYDKTQMTAHGFRAMASTLLNEMVKWHPDAIERQLAHVEGNDVRRAYARGEHWDERVRMMQDWSDYLDSLRDGATILTGNFGRG